MTEETVLRWISTLGFPVVASLAMGYVLYKIGTRLTDGHLKNLDANTDEMKKQTAVLGEIKETLPRLCRAECVAEPKKRLV